MRKLHVIVIESTKQHTHWDFPRIWGAGAAGAVQHLQGKYGEMNRNLMCTHRINLE